MSTHRLVRAMQNQVLREPDNSELKVKADEALVLYKTMSDCEDMIRTIYQEELILKGK